MSESGRELFKSCSTFNEFVATKDKKKKKRVKGNDCKNRFCPICAWRKAGK
ncbi:replication protein, partial [Xenorhabdus sp. 12]|nr:replication protein [Xenorhabdus sp. 12]MDX7989651.1 replication protein [Xenorhabdus sp. 12]